MRLSPLNQPPTIIDGQITRGRDRICVYAAGMGRESAPLEDPSWDVWALNMVKPVDSAGRLRADLWFDLHQFAAQDERDLHWIGNCPVPIVVPDDLLAAGENTVPYPLAAMLDHFPEGPLSCTFCYQIALALMLGYKTIGLFGVELAYGDDREATVEWAGVNWWIGYAEAVGIKIARPKRSRLGRHPHLYGFDYFREKESTEDYLKLREKIRRSMDG